MEELEDREHLLDCLAHLSENQRQRILMLAQGMSITEIARVQHADRTTVRESIQAARKKFKKYFCDTSCPFTLCLPFAMVSK